MATDSNKSRRPVIELYNVYLKSNRGIQVFRDLSFSLGQGETALLTGPAGSGKSSLVELLIGRIYAESGSVSVFDRPVKRRLLGHNSKVLRKIGGVGGIFSLIPSLNVSQNILFPLVVAGESRSVRNDRLFKMLTEFSLLKQSTEVPANLTRVENTLVQFARASIANQHLLIIDEPAAGLDSRTFARIAEYLVKASLSGRSMLILASDDLQLQIPKMKRFRFEGGALV